MQSKGRVKVIKYNKNLFYIVVSLNKKSIHSCYIDKLGVCFFVKKKKIILLSLKKLTYWVNKGIYISNFISYIFSIFFSYYIKNKKKNNFIFKNSNINLNIENKRIKKFYNSKILKYLKLTKKNF